MVVKSDCVSTAVKTITLLTGAQSTVLGVYLCVAGVIAFTFNMIGVSAFLRYPKVLMTPSAIPELSMLLADVAVACIHPFSGVSALMNGWIWGHWGCQMYGFFGFFFGNCQCLFIPLVAFDRYVLVSDSSALAKLRTGRNYLKALVVLAFVSFVWSFAPIIGWAQFAITPTNVSCTIDWTDDSPGYYSYMTPYALMCYVMPLMAAMMLTSSTTSALKRMTVEQRSAFVSWGCTLTTYIAFSTFAIVCVYPLFGDPADYPYWLNALPPVTAKMAGVINPIFFVWCNPKLWACVCKMIGVKYNSMMVTVDREDSNLLTNWFVTPPLTPSTKPNNNDDEKSPNDNAENIELMTTEKK